MNKTVENVLNNVILMLILTVFILIGYMGIYCYFGMFKFSILFIILYTCNSITDALLNLIKVLFMLYFKFLNVKINIVSLFSKDK